MPNGFSDYQLTLIRAAAEHVPVAWRSWFLQTVAARLIAEAGAYGSITDAMVQAAVAHVLQAMRPGRA